MGKRRRTTAFGQHCCWDFGFQTSRPDFNIIAEHYVFDSFAILPEVFYNAIKEKEIRLFIMRI